MYFGFTTLCRQDVAEILLKATVNANLAASWQNQQNDVRPAKTRISLGIRPVWSESSLSAWRKLGSLATHWAHSEDSDQTGRMPRLIWVFAGRTCHFVGFALRWLNYHQRTPQCAQYFREHPEWMSKHEPIVHDLAGQKSLQDKTKPKYCYSNSTKEWSIDAENFTSG